jgi:hypothetical protein
LHPVLLKLMNVILNITNNIAWLYGIFADLDSDKMDESIMDWIKQLVRISKTTLSTYP